MRNFEPYYIYNSLLTFKSYVVTFFCIYISLSSQHTKYGFKPLTNIVELLNNLQSR